MARLDAEPWVAGREGSFCHLVVIHSARRAGFEPRLAHITNDFSVAYAIVAAGAGVALVPELAGPPPPGVVVKPIAGAPPSRRIYAAVRLGERRPPGRRRDARGAEGVRPGRGRIRVRPGKRSSTSLRRSRFTSAVPSELCSISPLSRSTRKWCVRVDFVTE